jgi:hypothetical protein
MSSALVAIRKPIVAAQGGIAFITNVAQQTTYNGNNPIELWLPPGSCVLVLSGAEDLVATPTRNAPTAEAVPKHIHWITHDTTALDQRNVRTKNSLESWYGGVRLAKAPIKRLSPIKKTRSGSLHGASGRRAAGSATASTTRTCVFAAGATRMGSAVLATETTPMPRGRSTDRNYRTACWTTGPRAQGTLVVEATRVLSGGAA